MIEALKANLIQVFFQLLKSNILREEVKKEKKKETIN
jgi:hypothetical protein